jgi:hypothetical protein
MPFHVHDKIREPLFAILPVFNPFRFKSRWKHVERAIKHFTDAGVVLTVVEAGFNRRELAFADSGLDGLAANCGLNGGEFKHKYIGLHTKSELWLKENLINIGVQNLPYNWEQVIWLDGDISFCRPSWVGETIHALQAYDFIQPFTHARDVGPNYELLPEDHPHADGVGFIAAYHQGLLDETEKSKHHHGRHHRHHRHHHPHPYNDSVVAGYPYPGSRVFPGLAMAARRSAWDGVGGLPDYHIWGGSDWIYSHSLVGKRDGMIRNDLHPNYIKMAEAWYETCQRYVRRNVGYVEGSVFHYFHGDKQKRGYNTKHSLLAQIGFDPTRHLKRDSQGLWQMNDLGEETYVQLRDTLRVVAKGRKEDSTEVGDGK